MLRDTLCFLFCFLKESSRLIDADTPLLHTRYAEAESRYGPRPEVQAAVTAYCEIAQESGMSPTELALRWVDALLTLLWALAVAYHDR